MNRSHDLFPAGKPIIAMAPVPALPGTPLGSDLKADGHTWNPVDLGSMKRFMDAARS